MTNAMFKRFSMEMVQSRPRGSSRSHLLFRRGQSALVVFRPMTNAMFKRFSMEMVQSQNQTRSSVQRGIRQKLQEQMPLPEEVWEEILPSKANILAVKCHNHVTLVVSNNRILFFQEREGPYYPVMRLLQRYPKMLPRMQVDIGGCKFVLGGANIMCPGLTSKGGSIDPGVPKGSVVGIYVEGKVHPCAVGLMKMSAEEILTVNKGHGIESVHYMGDGLWHKPNID